MKKVGKVVLCFVPMIVCILMQFVAGIIFSIVTSFVESMKMMQLGITDMGAIQEQAQTTMMENIIWAVVVFHVLALIVFPLWYYFGCGKPKPAKIRNVMTLKTVIGTVILGVGIEFFVSTGVYLVGLVFPSLINNFAELMDNAGMAELSLGAVIGTVILAPVGEEILCRGLIFHYAKKVSNKFMIANMIQALAFGIMHMNLVQGVYAFVMGLVLGILYERFQSLYLCILAHFVINFSAMFIVDPVMTSLPDTAVVVAMAMAVSTVIWLVGLKVVGKSAVLEKSRQKMSLYKMYFLG